MAYLIPQSSETNPYAANYMGRMEVPAGVAPSGTIPMSSDTNPYAANYMAVQEKTPKYVSDNINKINTSNTQQSTPPPPPPSVNTDVRSNGGITPNVGDHIPGGPTGSLYWDGKNWVPDYGAATQINVDREFQNAIDYNTKLRNDWLAGRDTFLNAYTSPYEALRPKIESAYQQGLNLIQQQRQDVNTTTENAIAAARRLYNELIQGNRQRFGGSTSAGEFANEFQGRALGQRLGNIYSTQSQNINALNTQAANLQAQYTAQLNQLEAEKTAALNQAQNLFNQRLQAIDEQRGILEQQKAAMKIQELQNYRSAALQLQQYYDSKAAALQAQIMQGQQNLLQAALQYQALAGTPVNLSNIGQWMTYLPGGANNPIPNYVPTGYVDYTRRYQRNQ